MIRRQRRAASRRFESRQPVHPAWRSARPRHSRLSCGRRASLWPEHFSISMHRLSRTRCIGCGLVAYLCRRLSSCCVSTSVPVVSHGTTDISSWTLQCRHCCHFSLFRAAIVQLIFSHCEHVGDKRVIPDCCRKIF